MSIKIEEQVPLAPFTTMRVGGNAHFFVRVGSIEELADAVNFADSKNLPIFILGGGSNTVVSKDGFSGLVIKIELKGVTYSGNRVTASAGEVWDDVVKDVVSHNLWGVENLSLIPGTVGGAVVQNIGAYGVEVRETIYSVQAFDLETMQTKTFFRDECEFGYRESIFKKNKNLVVVSVTLKLSQEESPRIKYEDVKKYFESIAIAKPSLVDIRKAIIEIRTAKLPQPPIGTAGSFFKNPVVSMSDYNEIKNKYPEIKHYPQGTNSVKLSAGWLLDHVGHWRGARRGDAGVHEKQALILVNHGSANAKEIISLANEMKKDIEAKVGVTLTEEVVVI